MKRLLVLDSHFAPSLATRVIQCLAAAGRFHLDVASPHRDSGLRLSRWVERFQFVPTWADPAERIKNIEAMVQEQQPDLLLPVNLDEIELMISPLAESLRKHVKLPAHPSPEAFNTACSKLRLSAFMETHGIPHPKTVRVELGRPKAIAEAEALALPVIVKPTWGGGGRGMHIVRKPGELRPLLETGPTPENPLIVQEFIAGYDIGCAAYCEEGKIIAHTMQRNMAIDRNSVKPSKGLRFMDDPAVRGIAERLLGALGWNGIAQMDLRVDEATGEFHVLEINPRYWGSVLGSQRMGVNFPALAVSRALGLAFPAPIYSPGKYITSLGYLLHWKDRFLRRPGVETFRCEESGLREMASDPLATCYDVWLKARSRLLRR